MTIPQSTAGRSFIVSCASRFRDRVIALAERQSVSPADLARSVLLLVPMDRITKIPDPGEPEPSDREEITLRTGASAGRVLRRKPRLQMRLPMPRTDQTSTGTGPTGKNSTGKPANGPIYDSATLRKALALALSMAEGDSELTIITESDKKAQQVIEKARDKLADENEELKRLAGQLAMPILQHGVNSRSEALFILGFPPTAVPDQATIRRRWRQLAMIYHPDAPFGDHERMTQLNAAAEKLT